MTTQHPTQEWELAFYVRDLLDAAGYRYSPDGPLHGQVRECCELIEADCEELRVRRAHEAEDRERHAAEVQRLEDLVTELRKHHEARLGDIRDRDQLIEKLRAQVEIRNNRLVELGADLERAEGRT